MLPRGAKCFRESCYSPCPIYQPSGYGIAVSQVKAFLGFYGEYLVFEERSAVILGEGRRLGAAGHGVQEVGVGLGFAQLFE